MQLHPVIIKLFQKLLKIIQHQIYSNSFLYSFDGIIFFRVWAFLHFCFKKGM